MARRIRRPQGARVQVHELGAEAGSVGTLLASVDVTEGAAAGWRLTLVRRSVGGYETGFRSPEGTLTVEPVRLGNAEGAPREAADREAVADWVDLTAAMIREIAHTGRPGFRG